MPPLWYFYVFIFNLNSLKVSIFRWSSISIFIIYAIYIFGLLFINPYFNTTYYIISTLRPNLLISIESQR